MGEGLGIAAQHHVHVVELAVHLDGLGGHGEVVIGGRALLLGAVLRVGHHEQFLVRIAIIDNAAKVADDCAEVFARGNHAPAADGVEPHGDGALG